MAWPAFADDDGDEQPFGATSVIIELTDNDIELQVFVDGFLWDRLQMYGPNERRIFNLRTQRNSRRQGGLSELFFASEPTHYLEDEPEFDGTIEEFLARFPGGEYEFEGLTMNGGEKVPPEFLLPNAIYEFEILAIEVSGNSTIYTGEFITGE